MSNKIDIPQTRYYYHLAECPVGWLALLGTERGLQRVSLQPAPREALDGLGAKLQIAAENAGMFAESLTAFRDYFGGNNAALAGITLDMEEVSAFYGAAWQACRTIPPGETRSYKWLANAAGSPNAARAAGQAMVKNRLVLVVPCHRVIGSGGNLHGYGAGGLDVKARLLEMERDPARTH